MFGPCCWECSLKGPSAVWWITSLLHHQRQCLLQAYSPPGVHRHPVSTPSCSPHSFTVSASSNVMFIFLSGITFIFFLLVFLLIVHNLWRHYHCGVRAWFYIAPHSCKSCTMCRHSCTVCLGSTKFWTLGRTLHGGMMFLVVKNGPASSVIHCTWMYGAEPL